MQELHRLFHIGVEPRQGEPTQINRDYFYHLRPLGPLRCLFRTIQPVRRYWGAQAFLGRLLGSDFGSGLRSPG